MKIRVDDENTHHAPDKAESAWWEKMNKERDRYIKDILTIQSSKAYVNEKKQLQQLATYLYEAGYYQIDLDNKTISELYL